MDFPLTTTTARIDACNPCSDGRRRAMELLGVTTATDEPIGYAELLDKLGLDDALWCCRAEPALSSYWRLFAVWCARQVEHLMDDERSIAALDIAERYAQGQATDDELASARDSARPSAWSSVWDSARASTCPSLWSSAWSSARASTWPSAWSSAWDSASNSARASTWTIASPWDSAWTRGWDSARASQAAAFRQLVTTGTLP